MLVSLYYSVILTTCWTTRYGLLLIHHSRESASFEILAIPEHVLIHFVLMEVFNCFIIFAVSSIPEVFYNVGDNTFFNIEVYSSVVYKNRVERIILILLRIVTVMLFCWVIADLASFVYVMFYD